MGTQLDTVTLDVNIPEGASSVATTPSREGPSTPASQKVEGEIVNDIGRLRAVLDRGWDINKKIIGNWYLLLWPPQSLMWWAVDYNKVEALRLILSKVDERLEQPEQLPLLYKSINDALTWSRRKANIAMITLLEHEMTKLERLRDRSESLASSIEGEDHDDDEDDRAPGRQRRSLSSISIASTATADSNVQSSSSSSESPRQAGSNNNAAGSSSQCHEVTVANVDMLFMRMESLRHEQARIAGQVEFLRAKAEKDLKSTSEELEAEKEKLVQIEEEHESAASSYQSAKDQMEVAKNLFEAAQEQLQTQHVQMESIRNSLGEARSRVDGLLEKKTKLTTIAKRVEETVQSMLVPIRVDCSCDALAQSTAVQEERRKRLMGDAQRQQSFKSDFILECPVCRDQKVSRTFQCGHALCQECVKQVHEYAGRRVTSPGSYFQYAADATPKCPICKAVIHTVHPLYL